MDRIMRYATVRLCCALFVIFWGILISPVTRATSFDKLNCLSQNAIKKIKSQPSYAKDVYTLCSVELNKKLAPMHLTDGQRRLVFASILAQSIAPYGSGGGLTLNELLGNKTLHCASYVLLTGHIAKMISTTDDTILLHFVGFDGGAVGNHAQLIVKDTRESLLLDPTTGLVAKISFDDLLSGKSVSARKMHIFRQHEDKAIDSFAKKVERSVLKGQYKPSDLLYYFSSLDEFLSFLNDTGPLWGGDINKLILRYPTPAAAALKKNLLAQRAKKA